MRRPKPSDYVKVKGSKPPRWRNQKTKEDITTYAHNQLRAQWAGFDSIKQYRKIAKQPNFRRYLNQASYNLARASDEEGEYSEEAYHKTKRLFSHVDSEFAKLYAKTFLGKRKDGTVYVKDYDKLDKSPKGPLARFLVAVGYRDPKDTWNVGETPKVGSK